MAANPKLNTLGGSIGVGANAAGGILSAFGAISSGESQKGLEDYQAGVAQINAQTARQNADYAEQLGSLQQQQFGFRAGQQFGGIRTAQAASGLDVNSGSAKSVQDSQKLLTNLGETSIASSTNKQAYDFLTQATGFQNQAQLDLLAGKDAENAGYINAASGIISSAAGVSSKWLQGQQLGLWGSPSGNITNTNYNGIY